MARAKSPSSETSRGDGHRIGEDRVYASAGRLLETECRDSGILDIVTTIRFYGGYPLLFAGVVRDALHTALTGITIRPRDYDIGVARMSREDFNSFAPLFGGKRNRYGGYQFYASDGRNVDLWRMEDTVGVLMNGCPPTVTNILRTFILDLNASAYDPADKVFYDQGCLESLSNGRIGLVRGALLHDHSNFAARALSLQSRFQFKLSRKLREFVTEWYDSVEAERQHEKLHGRSN